MKKILLGLTCLMLFVGCKEKPREVDISADPQYKSVLGKEYKTKMDLVVYKNGKNSKQVHLAEIGVSGIPKIEELKDKKFPYDYYGQEIDGILPSGSQFKITNILANLGPIGGIDYKGIITSKGPFEGQTVYVTYLTNIIGDLPQFKPKYVEQIPAAVSK